MPDTAAADEQHHQNPQNTSDKGNPFEALRRSQVNQGNSAHQDCDPLEFVQHTPPFRVRVEQAGSLRFV